MMKKIALIYSFNTLKTKNVAQEIIKIYDTSRLVELNAETLTGNQLIEFDYFVLGVPTWFDGELPNYWDEFVPELETLDLKNKKFALFGNGDQVGYPENFIDAVGVLANILENQGATIIGQTSTEGYRFEKSKALKNGLFQGLAIDFENQSELNTTRIQNWIEKIKKEFV